MVSDDGSGIAGLGVLCDGAVDMRSTSFCGCHSDEKKARERWRELLRGFNPQLDSHGVRDAYFDAALDFC